LPGYKRLTAYSLGKRWNTVKDRHFPWVREYSKYIPEESFRKVDLAYRAAFARLRRGQPAGFPKFHKKGVNESFQVVPSSHFPLTLNRNKFRIPRVGFVRTETTVRWPEGKQVYGRVKKRAGRWWLILSHHLPDPPKLPEGRPACGVDVGCTTFATVASEGVVEEVAPPKPYAKARRRLRRAHRRVSRKVKGSANRKKAVLRLAKAHERVANIRDNFLHQLTSRLVKRFGVIVLEDLSVKGLAGGMLAKTVHDMGWGEFRRQVEYKAETVGTKVVFADRFYPSSKTCSACGQVKAKLGLSEREWTCMGCGTSHDRDHNAAKNLEKLGRDTPEVTPAESGGSGSCRKVRVGATQGSRNIQDAIDSSIPLE
jgi:putative transposase